MEFQIYTNEDKETFLGMMREMKPPFKAKVDNIYKNRSISQNRYYHLIKKMSADHLGLLPNEMHNEFLKMFALVEEKVIDGEVKCDVESTAGMSTLRMEKFLEDIKRWMLTVHGLYLADPNEMIDDTGELKLKLI